MDTIIEFILYAIGILMLVLVPVALIAGGLRCRSVVISSDLGNNHSEATSALIAGAKPAQEARRSSSNNFEGILINHKGQVRRVAPAYSPHQNPFKLSNRFRQKSSML